MRAPRRRDDELSPVTTRVLSALQQTRGGRFAGDTFKGLSAVIHGFRGERIGLRAAALTYISIFSLVPLLTVALVLIQSLHRRPFQARLLAFMHDVLAPGISDQSAILFERFVTRASAVTAGSVGFLMLLVSAGSLLKNLDASLNDIWRIRRKRPWHLRILYYAAILILGPLLVTVSLVGTANLHSLLLGAHIPFSNELFAAGTLLVEVGTLTLLYLVAPNAPVKLRSALAGGMVAGLGWELARLGYSNFGAQIIHYNPIYGSLGAAPLFLAWLYLSWMIVLFGARLAYAVEYASFQGTYRALGDHPRAKELVAAQMAQLITRAHFEGQLAPTIKDLARKLDVPEETIRELTEQLSLAGLVAVGGRGGIFPARHPDELTVAELSAAVGGVIGLLSHLGAQENSKQFEHLEVLFARIDHATVEKLAKVTWSSLLADAPTERGLPTLEARPRGGSTSGRNP